MTQPQPHPLTRTQPVPRVGIVHLGPGAFFRAFQAVYTDELIAAGQDGWGICAVSLRSATYRDQLVPQGGAYTSVALGPQGAQYRVINAIASVLVAPEDPAAVLAVMADAQVRIVSLTVTEKGYCHEPASGRLNTDDPDIQHDLTHLDAPRTAPGYIVAALKRRRDRGLRPFTVLSCDNLPSNGRLASGVVQGFARLVDADLARWIADHVRFPSTMVDRITPAPTHDDVAALAAARGVYDPACVTHEPFRQWVIEDDFVDGQRPPWDDVGAQFVADVRAHELMKLRCLNGTHSALAYLGYLAGYDTVADAVRNPAFARLCRHLWTHEIAPTVPVPEGEDVAAYCDALLQRFQNPAIRHRTWQIAMDGSQKLPQRILATMNDNIAAGRPYPGLALVVAGWMRYVGAVDETGAPIDVRDPLAGRLRDLSDRATSPEDRVAALLSVDGIFAPHLAQFPGFRRSVTAAYVALSAKGAQRCVEEITT